MGKCCCPCLLQLDVTCFCRSDGLWPLETQAHALKQTPARLGLINFKWGGKCALRGEGSLSCCKHANARCPETRNAGARGIPTLHGEASLGEAREPQQCVQYCTSAPVFWLKQGTAHLSKKTGCSNTLPVWPHAPRKRQMPSGPASEGSTPVSPPPGPARCFTPWF